VALLIAVGWVVGTIIFLVFWTHFVVVLKRFSHSERWMVVFVHALFRPPLYLAIAGLWFLYETLAGTVSGWLIVGAAGALLHMTWGASRRS
jgi:hypothetical protein